MVNHPNRSKATLRDASKEPKCVVVDGRTLRIYTSERFLGDREHIEDTMHAPVRCKTPKDIRDWFDQTLYARSLGGYHFIGDE
jgi:hypothetical protein